MADLFGALVLLWLFIPFFLMVVMPVKKFKLTIWLGPGTPLDVIIRRDYLYWSPLGMVAIEAEAEDAGE